MKITKKQIDMICSLPDDAMRRLIVSLAGTSGFDLSGVCTSTADLDRIRTLLREMNGDDISRLSELLGKQKN